MSGTRKRCGTTLVELSLVIAILAMIALPFAAFISQNLKNTIRSSTQLKEQMVLEQVMQDMENHLRSAVTSTITSSPGDISFTSRDPQAVISTLPTQTVYTYVLASRLLTKNNVTFPDGLEAGLITSLTFPAPQDLTSALPAPRYITVRLTTGTTFLQKTIYLRDYSSATQLTIADPTLTTSKPYDGNTTAAVTAVGTLGGVVSPDVVTVTAVATYDTAAVGTGKTITVVYTLAGAQAGNYVKPVNYTVTTGVITLAPINIAAIPGVTAPATGATPVTTITATAQYTGTVTWSGSPVTFAAGTIYTATITLTPTAGYTLTGVAANFFTVAGTTVHATNGANSGLVTAVFPRTASVAIGNSYGGGIVAYILQSGDPGYDANVQHGLIAATADQSTGIAWITGGSTQTTLNGHTSTAFGTGQANTNYMKAQTGYSGGAAKACDDYTITDGGVIYSDWYLPSKDELAKLYAMKVLGFGSFANNTNYWSSSESNATQAQSQNFNSGNWNTTNKTTTNRHVRAVRAF